MRNDLCGDGRVTLGRAARASGRRSQRPLTYEGLSGLVHRRGLGARAALLSVLAALGLTLGTLAGPALADGTCSAGWTQVGGDFCESATYAWSDVSPDDGSSPALAAWVAAGPYTDTASAVVLDSSDAPVAEYFTCNALCVTQGGTDLAVPLGAASCPCTVVFTAAGDGEGTVFPQPSTMTAYDTFGAAGSSSPYVDGGSSPPPFLAAGDGLFTTLTGYATNNVVPLTVGLVVVALALCLVLRWSTRAARQG
jgi:hypothetical protein